MKKCIGALGVLMISFIVSACSDKENSSALFTVGGVVSGSAGTLVLQNNGGSDLSVTANGSFAFPTAAASGSPYSVTIHTNPTGQTCIVSNGTGTILVANVTNVSVDCSARGGLDVTFNSPNGFVVQNNAAGGNGNDVGNAVAVDSQGRILVTGSTTSAGRMDMAIWRYTSNGTLDTTFNGSGFVVYENAAGSSGADSGKAVTVDSQDNILVTGSTTSAGNTDMAVWRFNANGTVDTGFGGDGIVLHNNAAGGNGNDAGNAIAIDSSKRIIVVGNSTNSAGNTDMVIWRFDKNGNLDTTFSSDGIVVQSAAAGGTNGNDYGNAIALDSSGRILVAGSSTNIFGDADMVLSRFTTTGAVDTTFNGSGIVIDNGAAGFNGDDYGNAIATDSQGILVTGSSTNSSGNKDMVLWRFKTDGSLDTDFGSSNNGIIIKRGTAGGTSDDTGNAVAVDSQGRILITGSSTNSDDNKDMVIWRVFP